MNDERPASPKMARLQGRALERETKLMQRQGMIKADRLRARISHNIGQGNAKVCMFFVQFARLANPTAQGVCVASQISVAEFPFMFSLALLNENGIDPTIPAR